MARNPEVFPISGLLSMHQQLESVGWPAGHHWMMFVIWFVISLRPDKFLDIMRGAK